MLLFAFLPWCAFWLLWRLLTLKGLCWRSAFLASFVICGVLTALSTEALSVFRLLNFPSLLGLWAMVCAVTIFFLRQYPNAFRPAVPRANLSVAEKSLAGCGILIVLIVGLIAIIAPPNTADSMSYHMARVMYWLQNDSVQNYPTADLRQLVYPPYAEYAILQAQVLSASDRFANLVQWTAMVGSAVGVSLIAKLLGADRRGQVLAAVFMLTVPMVVLQGSSTQTDQVAALWLVCGAAFLLQVGSAWGRMRVALCALSFGLAVLTKGTGLVFGLPFVLLWAIFFDQGIKRKLALIGTVLVAGVLLNAAFCVRLHEINGDLLTASSLGGDVTVDQPGVKATVSNILRNAASELALPWEDWNRIVERLVLRFHRALGIDPGDPKTTAAERFFVGYSLDDSLDEDCANNVLHTILIFITGVLFWFYRPKARLLWFYALAVTLGGLFFCVSVKWQPWICRFHLPAFVLLSPLVILVLAKLWTPRAVTVLVLLLALASVPYLFWNNSRRIFSDKSMFLVERSERYFAKNRAEYDVYKKIADALKDLGCREIGLEVSSGTWEYAWWPLLGWPKGQVRIEHVVGGSASARFRNPQSVFTPCAILAGTQDNMPPVMIKGERPYVRAAGSWILTVYLDPARLKR